MKSSFLKSYSLWAAVVVMVLLGTFLFSDLAFGQGKFGFSMSNMSLSSSSPSGYGATSSSEKLLAFDMKGMTIKTGSSMLVELDLNEDFATSNPVNMTLKGSTDGATYASGTISGSGDAAAGTLVASKDMRALGRASKTFVLYVDTASLVSDDSTETEELTATLSYAKKSVTGHIISY